MKGVSRTELRITTILVSMVVGLVTVILCCCIFIFLNRYRSAMVNVRNDLGDLCTIFLYGYRRHCDNRFSFSVMRHRGTANKVNLTAYAGNLVGSDTFGYDLSHKVHLNTRVDTYQVL